MLWRGKGKWSLCDSVDKPTGKAKGTDVWLPTRWLMSLQKRYLSLSSAFAGAKIWQDTTIKRWWCWLVFFKTQFLFHIFPYMSFWHQESQWHEKLQQAWSIDDWSCRQVWLTVGGLCTASCSTLGILLFNALVQRQNTILDIKLSII